MPVPPVPFTVIDDPVFYLLAVPAVIVIGLAKGGFVGVGVMATPLLALYAPPLEAAAVLLPISMVQDAVSIWIYRRDWDAWNLKVLIPGGIAGIGIAWAIAAYVPDAAVRLTIGIIGLGFVASVWLGKPRETVKAPSAAAGLFWGAVTGFTSTLSQGGGPPFQVFVLPQKLPKLVLAGTATIFFASINAMKVVPYVALGQFSPQGLGTTVALLPLAVVSSFAGVWLVRRIPTELFYRISYLLLFLLSLALLWQGGRALWPA